VVNTYILARREGFILGIGVLWPYLGRGLDLGIHNKIIGLLFLSIAALVNIMRGSLDKTNSKKLMVLFILFIIILLYSSQNQIYSIFSPGYGNYVEVKLSYFVYSVFLPTILVAFALSNQNKKSYIYGIFDGFLLISIIGVIFVYQYREYVIFSTWRSSKEFVEMEEFSIISMSLIFTFTLMGLILPKKRNWFINSIRYLYIFLLIFLILILGQRAHAMMLFVLMCFFIYRRAGMLSVFLSFFVLSVILLYVLTIIDVSEIYDQRLFLYWSQVLEGEATNSRKILYDFAFEGIANNPFGGGLASFAVDFPGNNVYPHNDIVEAFYELGLLGGVVMTYIVFSIVYTSVKVMRPFKNFMWNTEIVLFSFLGLFMVGHDLKAGSLDAMGLMLFMWFFVPVAIKAFETKASETSHSVEAI